jgi:hypothetical protein
MDLGIGALIKLSSPVSLSGDEGPDAPSELSRSVVLVSDVTCRLVHLRIHVWYESPSRRPSVSYEAYEGSVSYCVEMVAAVLAVVVEGSIMSSDTHWAKAMAGMALARRSCH